KRRKLGSHKSFAEDVEFAIQAAQDQKIEGLPHLLLYSLLYATLGSFATNVTTKMLLVLDNWKELERALSYVELMAEPEKRAYAFLTLGCHSEPFDLIGGMERRGKPD